MVIVVTVVVIVVAAGDDVVCATQLPSKTKTYDYDI